MCIYDKNQNYTVRQITTPIFSEHKNHWCSFKSAVGSVLIHIKQQGYEPVNEQKNCRVFSGIIAQKIYNHYNEVLGSSKKDVSIEKSHPKGSLSVFREVSVTFKSWAGEELDRRSKILNIPKNKILEDIITPYFKEHTCDRYDTMTAEELRAELRRVTMVYQEKEV